MRKIYNFSAGPAILPSDVLLKIQKDFLNWKKIGLSITEISHRHRKFIKNTEIIEQDLRDILNIPIDYQILFCHGGARGQFSAVPMNLLADFPKPDYINSGFWSNNAILEAQKYCHPNVINVKKISIFNEKYIESMKDWNLSKFSTYVHYCPNETIEGIEIFEEPKFKNKVFVGDFSSTLLSRNIDIKKYGIIYACAQKNIGPAGITIVIIKKNLLNEKKNLYHRFLIILFSKKTNSMFNTPTTFSWYVAGLVFQWIKKIGGISVLEDLNKKKSKILYEYIDSTNFYENFIKKSHRSRMNIIFYLKQKLTNIFIKEAQSFGLWGLQGHSFIGGLRASIYNAMPLKGVQFLIKFMKKFEKKFG
ncbi:phosphoserine aminotransferase [Buchnera aphidicola (Cinara tujafilina)]|uniref:Phosphoserine aminotransferase n=1 Tax=Buchnera aphidicola (Cinara tujafilina) TaxID=261317 RepID=F7WZC5_9GAMM|nr:3-phosphoserine/phosphohydroxythreonine transaminase [Buchnera aphidicola]AEH39787.1 phosphoserine aminotransferase [Buchnera aphidicola (Cinara tujafilina)]